MADGRDAPLLVDDKGTGNAFLFRRGQPAFGHAPVAAIRLVVGGHAVGHLARHGLHEGSHQRVVIFQHILADDHQALVREAFVEVVEVRDGRLAGAAPGGPKLDDVHLVALEILHRRALQPAAALQLGRGVTHLERRNTRLHAEDGERDNQRPENAGCLSEVKIHGWWWWLGDQAFFSERPRVLHETGFNRNGQPKSATSRPPHSSTAPGPRPLAWAKE